MKRRRFLTIILAFLGSITLFSFVNSLLKFLAALPVRTAETKKLIIRKNEVPSGDAKNIIFRNAPAVIINRSDKGFIALSRVCTHLGCLVDYNRGERRLLCPCHAGNFDLEGNVLSGPPPKPLKAIPLRIDGENIIIG
jgi:cytochrome b6-f complex iron-sulfur subunit